MPLMRSFMSDEHENILRTCNSVKQVRSIAEMSPTLQEAVHDSLDNVKLLISSTFQQLVLKDKRFEVLKQPASIGWMDFGMLSVMWIPC